MTSKEHYQANKDMYRKANREWIAKNRDKVNAAARRRYRLQCQKRWEDEK
jgi:head-tail adaptor